jgi:hypothetical protein
MSAHSHTPLPVPGTDRWPLIGALAAFAIGAAVLAFVLSGAGSATPRDQVISFPSAAIAQPAHVPAPVAAATPAAAAQAAPSAHATSVAAASPPIPMLDGRTHITLAWESGYYPIYAVAARTFAVNPLLIASIHKQESAFSTAAGIYHGLNFARCCAGPMQFNVTNGPISTWRRFAGAFRYGTRPATYPHATSVHPSVYDDFDAIMAGAWLLRANGAGAALDGTAWLAAYDYYGNDANGVAYADEVLARAQGWARDAFCVNCGVDQELVAQAYANYGAAAMAALAPPPKARKKKAKPASGDAGQAHVGTHEHLGVADHLHQP